MDFGRMKDKAEHIIEQLKELVQNLQQDSSGPELDEKRKQLAAIEKSVRQLQNGGVSIPDEIRNLKSKLVNELTEADQAEQALELIVAELTKILKELGLSITRTKTNRKPVKRGTGPKTEQPVLREHIIKALKHFGGQATMHQVLDWMGEQLKEKFTPRDLSKRKHGEIVWRNNTAWERHQMVTEGILKSDSPRGIWGLSEEYR
jgi:hypothetical protein